MAKEKFIELDKMKEFIKEADHHMLNNNEGLLKNILNKTAEGYKY